MANVKLANHHYKYFLKGTYNLQPNLSRYFIICGTTTSLLPAVTGDRLFLSKLRTLNSENQS